MKNKDMPAMPIVLRTCTYDDGDVRVDDAYEGLTKREMFAKDADVSQINEFDNYKEMASFVGESWSSSYSLHQNLMLKIKVNAKLKVMYADALLAELEK